eukprot:c20696_g1_i1 orf=174-1760(+)
MANQHAASTPTAPASLVGNAFVIRYYNILHQTPHLGYRFYTEESRVSRAEQQRETAIESATTLSGIHDKIMSLDYHATRTEIMTVDTQESLAGSVLVMVTGALYNASGVRCMFVQTFVLVPQEKSYFIVNDMFRFLDGGDGKAPQQLTPQVVCDSPKPHDSPADTVVDQGVRETTALSQTAHVSEMSETAIVSDVLSSEYPLSFREQDAIPVEKDHYELPLQTEVSDILEGTLVENEIAENNIEDQGELFASKSNEYQDILEESIVEEAPKKSYASILRLQKDSSKATVLTSAANISKVISIHIERSALSGASQVVQSTTQLPSGRRLLSPDHMDDMNAAEAEGDGRSVYVKSLPLNVTVAEIEEGFRKFGQLKPGGVNLRNQRIGVCYAFVEFEEASSAQRATEASPINMNGRQVYIEEKRIFPSRGGRGRPNLGRGYQSDGVRGHSFFNNARGMGRGPLESDRDIGRGRGMAAGRSGSGGRSFYMPNTFRRLDSQDGNSFRPMRRAGNQMGRNGPLARNAIMVAAA